MAFDGLIVKSISLELSSILIGAKIDKIYQPSKHTIVLGFYNNGNNYFLSLNASSENPRFHLTWHNKPNPMVAPNFCMFLRKYISGAKLLNIVTTDLERVVEFEFECYSEYSDKTTRKLVIEVMGRYSNILLLDHENIIMDSLKHFYSSREISPGKQYLYPKSEKLSIYEVSNFEEFSTILDSYGTGLQSAFVGFSNTFALYISQKYHHDLKDIYQHILSILKNLNVSTLPLKLHCEFIHNNQDYVLELEPNTTNLSLDINHFIDDFYYSKEENELFTNTKNYLLKVILATLQKYSKRLENINAKLKSTEDMETYRLYGELLISNLYKITANIDSITLENYYDNNEPIVIPLDKSLSPHRNADKYFKKYNKLKNTLQIVTKQKYETEKELDYLETLIYAIDNSITYEELQEVYDEMIENYLFKSGLKTNRINKSKKANSIHIVPIIIDGFKVYVGKNNRQNDYITNKLAKSNDIWFHTQKIHGSHVLLKIETHQPDDIIIEKCAKLAAKYSKAKNSSNVPVDYTFIKHVKKMNSDKLGQVFYTNQKTIYVTP